MTAEVAIMNRKGLAIAADSAVTLGGSDKIYNTADKLFAMSRYHPVGIMIFANTTLMGVEWETIIKCYRDNLGEKSFDTLSEYAGDFINYLSKFPYFTDIHLKRQLSQMCYDLFSLVLKCFLDELYEKFDKEQDIERSRFDGLFDTTLASMKMELLKIEDQKHVKIDTNYIDTNIDTVNEMMASVFENYRLSKDQMASIIELFKINLQKCGWINTYTGIVIAGYGEREIFPVVHEFFVSGRIGKSLIYFAEGNNKIDGIERTSFISPYAQTEMVLQFANGVDLDFVHSIDARFQDVLHSLEELLKDKDKPKIAALSELLTEYITARMDNVYKNPIVNTVACMEKAELVSMAEAMVSLTALKRHVSSDAESVGGPVDVALITKGDGFVWIKRKLSYDQHLNRDLNQKYFLGENNGGQRHNR
jgi:hypothetical protein